MQTPHTNRKVGARHRFQSIGLLQCLSLKLELRQLIHRSLRLAVNDGR